MYAELSLSHPKCTKCGALFLTLKSNCNVCGEWSPEKQLLPEGIRRGDDSDCRPKAVQIVIMRQAGLDDEQIGAALGIKKSTISALLYKAGKNGWLDFDDPKNRMEYQVLHKVIRNIDEALDSEVLLVERKERTAVALEIYKANKATEQPAPPVASVASLMGIKIQIVGGDPGTVREGTVMGNSTYVDTKPVQE